MFILPASLLRGTSGKGATAGAAAAAAGTSTRCEEGRLLPLFPPVSAIDLKNTKLFNIVPPKKPQTITMLYINKKVSFDKD